MVFFTCNACGSSLKKNQVEKHYRNECRNCSVLSCMDCGQDFHGDEYAAHTKCISEAEKYQGAMYKATGNKGDQKQEAWLERAKEAVSSATVSPRLASLLNKVIEYPNIPRKKKKFENMVRNSCNVRDQKTLDDLWNILSTDTQTSQGGTEDKKAQERTVQQGHNGQEDGTEEEMTAEESKEKTKQLEADYEEEGGVTELKGGGIATGTSEQGEVKKKKKKRDKELTTISTAEERTSVAEQEAVKKLKKKKQDKEVTTLLATTEESERTSEVVEDCEMKEKKGKKKKRVREGRALSYGSDTHTTDEANKAEKKHKKRKIEEGSSALGNVFGTQASGEENATEQTSKKRMKRKVEEDSRMEEHSSALSNGIDNQATDKMNESEKRQKKQKKGKKEVLSPSDNDVDAHVAEKERETRGKSRTKQKEESKPQCNGDNGRDVEIENACDPNTKHDADSSVVHEEPASGVKRKRKKRAAVECDITGSVDVPTKKLKVLCGKHKQKKRSRDAE